MSSMDILVSLSQTRLWSQCDQIDQFSVSMVLVCLPSDALLQHLSSYLGFSYLGRGVSLHGCSSKVQPLLLTLDEGYLLTAALPDLQCGIAPLGPPAPSQPGLRVTPLVTAPGLGRGLLLLAAASGLGRGGMGQLLPAVAQVSRCPICYWRSVEK